MTEETPPESGEELVGDRARAMVGAEVSRVSGPVTRREFQRWAAAVGDRNPLYFDAEYARAHGYRDVIAPPLYLSYATGGVVDLDALRPDGLPARSGAMVPLPKTPRLMAGGDSWEFFAPAYAGDTVTGVRRIETVEQKQGRSGPFVLVTASTTYYNQDGEVLARATDTLLARP